MSLVVGRSLCRQVLPTRHACGCHFQQQVGRGITNARSTDIAAEVVIVNVAPMTNTAI